MARIPRYQGAAAIAAIFPAPDHDHLRCSSGAMAIAEALCRERGQRLTSIRRDVLATLLDSHRPLGAYDIMERLVRKAVSLGTSLRTKPAPITVYRALEFLRTNGLVHRIESRNAFVACVHSHAAGDLILFLICERCGAVGEASSAKVAATIKLAARKAGFSPKSPVIEISGICTHCGKA
jgi:Fur family zinc uptake transcriptional regulator